MALCGHPLCGLALGPGRTQRVDGADQCFQCQGCHTTASGHCLTEVGVKGAPCKCVVRSGHGYGSIPQVVPGWVPAGKSHNHFEPQLHL